MLEMNGYNPDIPAILVLRGQRRVGFEFEVILDYLVRPYMEKEVSKNNSSCHDPGVHPADTLLKDYKMAHWKPIS